MGAAKAGACAGPSQARQVAEGGDEALEIYDYPGEYVAAGVGKALAKVRLEELR